MASETAILDPEAAQSSSPLPLEPVRADRPRLRAEELVERWQGISQRAGALLRDPAAPQFLAAVRRADDDITALLAEESERSLLLMIQSAGAYTERYSVRHAVLVTSVCELAARLLPEITEAMRRSLRHAALTMNLGMTRLQDQLALQDGPLTPDQRDLVHGHAERGHELLGELGVTDELWLKAVLHHHDAPPGALLEQPPGMQLARLIQRADLFAARMSPRKLRAALSANVAAKGTYLDERKQPDMAGALVIKALGVYPVGSFVQLANGKVAVVLKRGPAASKPLVAAVADGNGSPYVQPSVRSTDTKDSAVVRGVPPKEVRVRVPIERLLKLAK